MIKGLIVPAVLGLVVSMAGSAGYAVMHAKTSYAAFIIVQDSLAKHQVDSMALDSTSHGEADQHATPETDSTDAHATATDGSHAPDGGSDMPSLAQARTPADSIRALIAEREARNGGTKEPAVGKSGAKDPKDKPTPDAHAAPPDKAGSHAPEASRAGAADSAKSATSKPDADVPLSSLKTALDPTGNVLPEKRLAKIFGAMSAKDAAKVLEQMTDKDVRTILSMMGDRQAAAVLSAFPAARAATISKAANTPTGSITP